MVGLAFTWGLAFSGLGAVVGLALVLGLVSGVLPPSPNGQEGFMFYGLIVLSRVVRWAAIGALSGVVFAGTVTVAGRRETLASLPPRRFARWGLLASALGGAAMAIPALVTLLPHASTHTGLVWVLAVEFAGMPVLGGVLGRATAAATLRLARRDVRGLASPAEDDKAGAVWVADQGA
jgi:hypothetical protein